MIFPAWIDLINDDAIVEHPIALRLYTYLMREPLAFVKPQDVKVTEKAYTLRVHPDSVRFGLNLLIDRGYLLDCGRGFRGIRSVMLLIERNETGREITCPPNQVVKAA